MDRRQPQTSGFDRFSTFVSVSTCFGVGNRGGFDISNIV
jgi:hypothetical protein